MEKEGRQLNEETLDATISSLEYKMETGTLSLKEEKKILQEIKKLKSIVFGHFPCFQFFCNS